MADIPVPTDHDVPATDTRSGWAVGWTAFAGVLMLLLGAWWMLAGLVALFNDEFFVVTQEYVFQFDTTTWGWVHLVLGAVIAAAGLGVYSGAVWARTVGVVLASLASLVAFAWIPWYPVWGIVFLVTSVAVIWALTAHGRDIASM